MKDRMLDLLEKSILVQSTVTLLMLSTVCTLYLVPVFRGGEPGTVPESLLVITGTVMGYWFKTKDRFNAEQKAAEAL